MNENAKSLAEKYEGERFELIEKFVKKFTPAVSQYLLLDGSWCARVNGLVVFKDHGIHNIQRERGEQDVMRPTVIVTSSKGDNFKIEEVAKMQCNDKSLLVESFDQSRPTFDRIMRDRDIYIENIEVVDVGF